MAKATSKSAEIDIIELKRGELTAWLLGETPLYCNRLAEKAKRELLLPRGRLTGAQKQTHLKHDPVAEFRASPYKRVGRGETRIMMPGSSPKQSIAAAALDMPTGVSKAQIGRMVYMPEEFCPVWGIPRLAMDVVRQADIGRTPDIRSRARLDRWAMRVRVLFAEPMLNTVKVAGLLAAAGMLAGIGDWRQQRGSASYGSFRLVAADDPDLLEIVRTGGQEAQDAALKDPVCATAESEDLLQWFLAELDRRGRSVTIAEDDDAEDAPLSIPASLLNGHDGEGDEAVI